MKKIEERVLNNNVKKIYNLNDIGKWLNYGLKLGVVKKSNKKEDILMLYKWVDLLGNKNIEVQKKKGKYIKYEREFKIIKKERFV